MSKEIKKIKKKAEKSSKRHPDNKKISDDTYGFCSSIDRFHPRKKTIKHVRIFKNLN